MKIELELTPEMEYAIRCSHLCLPLEMRDGFLELKEAVEKAKNRIQIPEPFIRAYSSETINGEVLGELMSRVNTIIKYLKGKENEN